jgi:hypothetical protein
MAKQDSALAQRLKDRERAFREDIAAQLRGIREGIVSVNHDRIVLELESDSEGTLRIVVGFNEDGVSRPGWTDWLQLRIETEDRTTPLLTLAWLHADDEARLASLESRLDADAPLDARGLNSAADIREGAYARGDALERLRSDLGAARQIGPRSHALMPFSAAQQSVVPLEPVRESTLPPIFDAEFEPVGQSTGVRQPPLEELKKRLIGDVVAKMTDELRQLESQQAGAGVGGSAKEGVVQAIEWGMLGVSYAAEVFVNRTSLGQFMGLPPDASWVMGLIGPVVVGGLASILDSRAAKTAGIGLIASWAIAVAVVTASNPERLDAAQAYFGKGQGVIDQEKVMASAKIDLDAAERELTRLEKEAGVNVGQAIAAARKRWQADEVKADAERKEAKHDKKLETARGHLKKAQGRLSDAGFELHEAELRDGSRQWAWGALFALCATVNFLGPLAVSRVLEKWEKEREGRQRARQNEHQSGAKAKHLRHGRAEQESRAIALLTDALNGLAQEGIARERLEQVNAAELADEAARSFDRTVNSKRKLGDARPS